MSSPSPAQSSLTGSRSFAATWHAVWRPFRSQASARGFAQRLARMTGREYRVERVSPSNYQVQFAYTDETDRITGLEQIQIATGLMLSEEKP